MFRGHRLAVSKSPGAVVLVLLSSLVAAGCANVSARHDGQLLVVGAERQYADLLSQLGGRYVSVVSILDNPSVDPHAFEATTSVARDVSDANLIVQNGLGYDSFMNSLESATSPSRRVILSAQQVFHATSGSTNPHLWYRVSAMDRLSRSISYQLARLDPRHRTYFQLRLRKVEKSFARLTDQVKQFRHLHRNIHVLVSEPVANYLLSELGVTNVTPVQFERDVMNGVDPAPQDVARSLALVRSGRLDALVYNEQVSDPGTSALRSAALKYHVALVAVYETMPNGFHYQSWMSAEIVALTRAIELHQSTTRL